MAKEPKTTDRQEIQVASSQIVNYYNQIENLKHQNAIYIIKKLDMKEKYQGDFKNMEEDDREIIRQIMQEVRYAIIRSWGEYQGLLGLKLKKFKLDPELEKLYSLLIEEGPYVMDSKQIEAYAKRMNDILTSATMKNLLESSQELLQDLYDTSTE